MKNILLVEDEESLVNVISLNFEMEKYHVEVASTGTEALHKFDDSIDLIVLDVMLPEKNGFDVCEEIRKTSRIEIDKIFIKCIFYIPGRPAPPPPPPFI